MRRKYAHVQAVESEIIRMREEGKTRQEIAEALGLEKGQIKDWINRYNHRGAKGFSIPKQRKGRPRKTPLTAECELELKVKQLEREVDLYRSFLHAAGRM